MRQSAWTVAVWCLFIGGATAAQAQGVAFGVKGGVNFSTIALDDGDEDIEFTSRTGFVGGLFVVWPANARFALQLEGLYSQNGAEFEEAGVEAQLKFDYVQVPVVVRASTARNSSGAAFHVFGGPSLGIRLNAKSAASFEGESFDEDVSEDVEKIDIGVVAGAGAEFGRIVVDGRYTWGLRNLNNNPGQGDPTIKNRAFAVMAGVRF